MGRFANVYRLAIGVFMLWCLLSGSLDAQNVSGLVITYPQAGQVFAWGQNAPNIRIEAQVSLATGHARPFVTANVLSPSGQVLDRVPLFDDGTHGDDTANDGRFANTYRPLQAGTYLLKARLQFTDTTTGISMERWSDSVSFVVKQVPYCRIVSPSPGQTVANRIAVTATLLIGAEGSPYRPTAGEQLRIRAWAEPRAETTVPERVGERFKASFALPRAGQYRLYVAVQSLQNGQWVESEADAVTVSATSRSYQPLYVSGLLVLLYFLLLGRQVRLYRHRLQITGRETKPIDLTVDPKRLETVTLTVGGADCDVKVPSASGKLFTIIAKPGEARLTVRVEGDPPQEEQLYPDASLTDVSGKVRLSYNSCESVNTIHYPRYTPSTRAKQAVLGLVILSVVWFVYSQFAYTMLSQSNQ